MLNIIIAIVAVFFLVKFSGPILSLLTKVFGMAEAIVDVGDEHVKGWKDDAKLSAKINSERKKKQLADALKEVNAQRQADGKEPLKMD